MVANLNIFTGLLVYISSTTNTNDLIWTVGKYSGRKLFGNKPHLMPIGCHINACSYGEGSYYHEATHI